MEKFSWTDQRNVILKEHPNSELDVNGIGPIHIAGMSSKDTNWSAYDENSRNIQVGRPAHFSEFPPNEIRTSKYTIFTWIPKSLFIQFRRISNVYFLIMSILATMPFSPKNPFSIGITFAGVLVFTMLKEAYEDYFRHKQDNIENSKKFATFNREIAQVIETECRNIKVGDIVIIKDGEFFPADLLLVSSSNPNGKAYVNTMNLDGETNLKEKSAHDTTKRLNMISDLPDLFLDINCDHPSSSLVKWNCSIKLPNNEWEPLGMKQLLMKGCILKNVEYIFGVVIYTGHETKIMLNSKHPPSKISNVLKKMNKILYSVFAFQIFICILFAALSVSWQNHNSKDHVYLELEHNAHAGNFIINILTFWISYSHLIPISLYVALEIVKLMLCHLISQDLSMYYEPDNKPAFCRSSDLVEELGQVEFIFSDKTGTLTCNMMEFRKCMINYIVYGTNSSVFGEEDTRPHEILQDATNQEHLNFLNFFRLITACHTVFPVKDINDPDMVEFHAMSPDELALVECASSMNIKLNERNNKSLVISVLGEPELWNVVVEIPFNSDRKRMSVIVEDPQSKELILMTKGADSVMLNLLNSSADKPKIEKCLHDFAVDGLRILVMGQRKVNENEFDEWYREWRSVELCISSDKEQRLDSLAELIERDLDFIGCSAIEDKLQDEVPSSIQLLIEAGIRVWVLTGDKEETAIEIGKSCNLIQENMDLFLLSSTSYPELKRKLEEIDQNYNLEAQSYAQLNQMKSLMASKMGVVINGLTLSWIFDDPDKRLERLFFKIGYLSNSCICCRVSPAQKMQLVQLAKRNGDWITLSIGDGANDVSMIQEAHIGVGIAGKEGTQAVQAADFSFSQFRFITQLLLVHGRWAYRRVSWFICYYFYKNFAVVFTEIWFVFFNGFSAQIFFLDWLPLLYNAMWTSWPCIITYAFEQDLNAKNSIKYPIAYKAGHICAYFTIKKFWLWICLAIWHGALIYWMSVYAMSGVVDKDGQTTGMWWCSTLAFTIIIHLVVLKLFLESIFWTKFSILVVVGSLILYYNSIIILNTAAMGDVFQPEIPYVFFNILSVGKSWIVIIIGPLIALIPDFCIAAGKFLYWPSPVDSLMKYVKYQRLANVDGNS
ncbi:unnamed protein product [Blepharisma stoltei]|uniref:Phospholipid-transporting ATPase n=1 Tax=Blepharisma stoltei TaxID=1481888 RepID=A0AAU9JVM5_9CILI|nr:unnamed protein product [Blepharisma stoltei]